ncbi:MAG: hypothetical protein ACFE85_05245 [Candidatus Hodarchaeota archaeon]
MNEANKIEKSKNSHKIFGEAIEYFDRFNDESLKNNLDDFELQITNSNILRDQMLHELNHLKEIILNNPDRKFEQLSSKEKKKFQKFIRLYSSCPICGNFNHYTNLRSIFLDDQNQDIIENLNRFIKIRNKKLKYVKISFGIPCCTCYKKLFNE